MGKRLISFATALICLFSLILAAIPNQALAYQNPLYYKGLKIQLKSMASTGMVLTLNGKYRMNGNLLDAGTTLLITAGASQLLLNGAGYDEIQLIPENSADTIRINNGTSSFNYLGGIDFKLEAGKVMAYNTIDMENYLKGVVGYEMAEYFPLEALKVQAVAARSYALKKAGSCAAYGYDFDDTELFQVYRGYNSSFKNVIRAVDDTRGMVLLHKSILVETLYSASNGGYTENSENVWGNYAEYLRGKPDTYDSEPWPYGNLIYSNPQIENILKARNYLVGTDKFDKFDLENMTKFESGRIASLGIIYTDMYNIQRVKYVTRDAARAFLGFPSSMYSISYDEASQSYTFSGRGNGHGLGMSQIGAKNRALAGQTFEDILKFYYDGSYLETIPAPAGEGGIITPPETEPVNNTAATKPELKLLNQPDPKYNSSQTISLSVSAPNYMDKVEYRVLIYNGNTKRTIQFYNTPATGYYNRTLQPKGYDMHTFNIPVKDLPAGLYNVTILTRKAGTNIAYDSYVKTNNFTIEQNTAPSRGGTVNSSIPSLRMITPPKTSYSSLDRISFVVSAPNYGNKVEYRVILYNGTTKKTSELWNTPATGYYYRNWQPAGTYNFQIHWPAKGMAPGAYSITVLVRKAGSKTPYDSYVKSQTFWIK